MSSHKNLKVLMRYPGDFGRRREIISDDDEWLDNIALSLEYLRPLTEKRLTEGPIRYNPQTLPSVFATNSNLINTATNHSFLEDTRNSSRTHCITG